MAPPTPTPAVEASLQKVVSSIQEISAGGQPPMLKKSSRRPSVPIDMHTMEGPVTSLNSKPSRVQQLEYTIIKQGWLTKQSRGGLPNWNKRWFILIGGSMYYAKSESPDPLSLSVFTELLHATRVELVTTGDDNSFKLVRASATRRIPPPLLWLSIRAKLAHPSAVLRSSRGGTRRLPSYSAARRPPLAPLLIPPSHGFSHAFTRPPYAPRVRSTACRAQLAAPSLPRLAVPAR